MAERNNDPPADPLETGRANVPHRPLDDLGPPANPLPFPRPQLLRGRRDTVVVYNPDTDEHEVVENVLFRDFARGDSHQHVAETTHTTRHAYWPNPYKEPIQT